MEIVVVLYRVIVLFHLVTKPVRLSDGVMTINFSYSFQHLDNYELFC